MKIKNLNQFWDIGLKICTPEMFGQILPNNEVEVVLFRKGTISLGFDNEFKIVFTAFSQESLVFLILFNGKLQKITNFRKKIAQCLQKCICIILRKLWYYMENWNSQFNFFLHFMQGSVDTNFSCTTFHIIFSYWGDKWDTTFYNHHIKGPVTL